MDFNEELYREYRRVAGKEVKVDGIWSVTRFPNGLYCFPTKQWLGDNGRIDNYPMLGRKFRKIKTGEIYIMDSVCIHWYNVGFYYHATLRDEKNSHATVLIENINCNNEIILEGIRRFKTEYELIED
jgi:hypothetical protein